MNRWMDEISIPINYRQIGITVLNDDRGIGAGGDGGLGGFAGGGRRIWVEVAWNCLTGHQPRSGVASCVLLAQSVHRSAAVFHTADDDVRSQKFIRFFGHFLHFLLVVPLVLDCLFFGRRRIVNGDGREMRIGDDSHRGGRGGAALGKRARIDGCFRRMDKFRSGGLRVQRVEAELCCVSQTAAVLRPRRDPHAHFRTGVGDAAHSVRPFIRAVAAEPLLNDHNSNVSQIFTSAHNMAQLKTEFKVFLFFLFVFFSNKILHFRFWIWALWRAVDWKATVASALRFRIPHRGRWGGPARSSCCRWFLEALLPLLLNQSQSINHLRIRNQSNVHPTATSINRTTAHFFHFHFDMKRLKSDVGITSAISNQPVEF